MAIGNKSASAFMAGEARNGAAYYNALVEPVVERTSVMWRGIMSIVALLIIIGSLIIIVPIMIIPNTFLHQVVPVLKPLHQAIACNAEETMQYEQVYSVESYVTHFRCVDAAGRERDVNDILLRPAHYSLGTLCLGVILMLGPLFVAVRQGMRGETSPELQAVLKQSYEQLRQVPTAMTQSGSATVSTAGTQQSGTQQLEALDKLRQLGLISPEAYEIAKQQIIDNSSA
jgi:hypothetical protein